MKIIKHLDDYLDHQRQSSIDYEKENSNLRKTFVIEYCEDERKLERIDLCGDEGLEYDEVYETIRLEEKDEKYFNAFDGIAIGLYLRMLFSKRICDVKLWEEIYNGDELIQERWIEFPSTFYHEFGKMVAKDVMESRDALKKQVDPLTKEIENFNQFLKEMNAEKTYKEWKEKRNVK